MADKPDFSKIWASESPLTPYSFADADYLKGWAMVGDIPPDRRMFDALQRRNDEKLKWVSENAALNLRKPLTVYAVGDIAYSPLLPSWAYIECTVGGTTSSGDLPVPSSVVANDTFTDGTVTWKVRKVGFDNEQELATKANRDLSNLTQIGQDSFLERDFTIIYPNGGTEANPASVAINSRYVETNPFVGYYVACIAELQINGKWGKPSFVCQYQSGLNKYYGTSCNQLDDGSLVVQTGEQAVAGLSHQDGSPYANTGTYYSSAPCRVKVWKIGKIPT